MNYQIESLSCCSTRLKVLVSFLCMISLIHELHGNVIPKSHSEESSDWNKVTQMKFDKHRLMKRSLLKTCYQEIKTSDLDEEIIQTTTPFMNFKPLKPPQYQFNSPKPNTTLNLNLFRNSPKTHSRSLNQIKSSNSRILSLCQKFFTRLTCGAADKRKYNLMEFDTSSSGMSQSSLLTLNPTTRSFKNYEDIKPMHQEQDRPMSIDEKLAIKFDNVKSDKEIISPSPSTRLSLSESIRNDDDDSDQDKTFSFYADDGKSIRGLTMSSPARFPTPEHHE